MQQMPMEEIAAPPGVVACNWIEDGCVCGKMSEPGKTLCPRHGAMRVARLQKEIDKGQKAARRGKR